MKTYRSIFDFSSTKKTILTLGTFDGVHLGHQSILAKLKKATENGKYESVVLTFFPHPRMVLNQDHSLKLLNTIEEKTTLFANFGIDNLIIHPFDAAFSQLTAEEFVATVLVEKLGVHKIIIGYDHRFGINRSANIEDLIGFGKKYGFEVMQISAKEINAISVSSTKIRKALLEGAVQTANEYLGRPYTFTGTVVEGKKNGRTIGFPTANIRVDEPFKLIPRSAVYVVSCQIESAAFYGMMNIGTNPTLGPNQQTIEIHLFNFDRDIYAQSVTISLVTYLREEEKFDSMDALKQQLLKDQTAALAYLKKL